MMLFFWILFIPLVAFASEQDKKLNIITRRIEFKDYPNSFNPSILKTHKEILLTFRYNPERQKRWISHVVIVRLDESLNPISKPQILSIRSTEKNPSYYDDCRLFSFNGKKYIIYHDVIDWDSLFDPNINPFYNYSEAVHMAELIEEDGIFKVLPPVKLTYRNKKVATREKNWMPFEWNNDLFLIYYPAPHEVVLANPSNGQCDLFSISHYPKVEWKWGGMRGGTPPIKIGNDYLTFFHSSCQFASKASNGKMKMHYFMGAYTFQDSPPFTIRKVSSFPIIAEGMYTPTSFDMQVIFPMSCFIHNNQVYLAYGKNDEEMWIAIIPTKQLLSSLIDVSY